MLLRHCHIIMLYKVLGGLKAQKGTIFDPWISRRSQEPNIITVPWQFKLIHNLSRKYKRHQSFFFVSVSNLKTAEFSALIFSENKMPRFIHTDRAFRSTFGAFWRLQKVRVIPPENYQSLWPLYLPTQYSQLNESGFLFLSPARKERYKEKNYRGF